jgi:hypothetical protein
MFIIIQEQYYHISPTAKKVKKTIDDGLRNFISSHIYHFISSHTICKFYQHCLHIESEIEEKFLKLQG